MTTALLALNIENRRADLLAEAIKQATLAYQFALGSYTYSALTAIIAASEAYAVAPDWIKETLEWNASDQRKADRHGSPCLTVDKVDPVPLPRPVVPRREKGTGPSAGHDQHGSAKCSSADSFAPASASAADERPQA